MCAMFSPHEEVMRFKKRKARFTFSEVHILLDEVRKNRHIVVGKFNRGVPTDVKKTTWAEITARVNEIGESQREVIEVIKKWSDLKCDTKRKVAAMRAGALPYKNINSRLSRDLSPIENIVHQILELDGKRGRVPTSERKAYTGAVEQDEGADEEEEDEEEDSVLEMPAASVCDSANGRLDASPCPLPLSLSGALPVPPATHYVSTHMQPLGEERRVEASQAPMPAPDDTRLTGQAHASAGPAAASADGPASPWCGPGQARPSPQDRMMESASLSVREQQHTNELLRAVSRSLGLLSESVQQLVETQQEFVHDSLQLQRETVLVLRDFASGALSLMHDKLNGRPAV